MYIGKTPTVGNFQVCDAISVVNGQAAYTLQVGGSNVEPESANHMLVSLNGILQKPGSSFTISGSTMTFASNLATGDVIDFVQILGNVLDIGQPSDDTVTAAKINNDVISGQTALTSSPDDTDELLISDAGTIKRIDVSLVGGKNSPSFKATMSADQDSLSSEANTKVAFNTESWDVTGVYDHSTNYRFTPAVVGKYLISAHIHFRGSNDFSGKAVRIYKNGSFLTESQDALDEDRHHSTRTNNATITTIVSLDADDYIEVYGKVYGSAYSIEAEGSYFTGFKLIGV